jgi:hypothetical protein
MPPSPEEFPSVGVDSPRGLFYITADAAVYRQWVREGRVVFGWTEMDRMLDAEPSKEDLDWAIEIKRKIPGVRIDNVKERVYTTPRSAITIHDPK